MRDAEPNLSLLGAAAVGISPDAPEEQAKFDVRYGLGFPLLSDADRGVAEALGVLGEKVNYGRIGERTPQDALRGARRAP